MDRSPRTAGSSSLPDVRVERARLRQSAPLNRLPANDIGAFGVEQGCELRRKGREASRSREQLLEVESEAPMEPRLEDVVAFARSQEVIQVVPHASELGSAVLRAA